MKKILTAFTFSIVFFSCSDGDLQIEAIDFESTTIEFCSAVDEDTRILFKRNANEALILELQSGVLSNGSFELDTVETTSTIPSQSKLIYRIFTDDVSTNYFCDEIPPITPTVIEEVTAENGLLSILTTVNADTTAFVHSITLQEISFVNAQGERLTDLNVGNFGTITTPIPQDN